MTIVGAPVAALIVPDIAMAGTVTLTYNANGGPWLRRGVQLVRRLAVWLRWRLHRLADRHARRRQPVHEWDENRLANERAGRDLAFNSAAVQPAVLRDERQQRPGLGRRLVFRRWWKRMAQRRRLRVRQQLQQRLLGLSDDLRLGALHQLRHDLREHNYADRDREPGPQPDRARRQQPLVSERQVGTQ